MSLFGPALHFLLRECGPHAMVLAELTGLVCGVPSGPPFSAWHASGKARHLSQGGGSIYVCLFVCLGLKIWAGTWTCSDLSAHLCAEIVREIQEI